MIKFFKKTPKEKKVKLTFHNSKTFLVEGGNLEKTLNYLVNQKVYFFSIEKISSKQTIVEIKKDSCKKALRILKNRNFDAKLIKNNGFCFLNQVFFQNLGVFCAIILCCVFFLIAKNFVFNVEILGANTVSKSEIIEALESNNVKKFSNINNINCNEIESMIIENFNNVSLVSVIKKGTTLVINIKEKASLSSSNFSPLIASQNGMITSINLIQGTLKCKVGDIVRCGDILVEGYTRDANENKIDIQPKAEIIADVWLVGETQHLSSKVINIKTGNAIKEKNVEFLGRNIIGNKALVPFENYEVETKKVKFSGGVLPIYYSLTTYYETTTIIKEENFEQVKDDLLNKTKKLALLQVLEDETIKEEKTIITESFGKTIVQTTLTVSRKIV